MEIDRFKSSLGEVAVTKTHIERKVSDSDDWERIRSNFSEEKLIENTKFSEIEDMELEKGSVYPNIKLKVNGNWKRLFFQVGDEVDECFRRLRYRWRAFQQNN